MKKQILLVVVTVCGIYCSKKDDSGSSSGGTSTNPVVPTLTTIAISAVTPVSAQTGGNIIADGGVPVTARGVCWGSSSGPTISGSKTDDGPGTGSFTSTLTGLAANTAYYVRAYATNSKGTAYGNEISFTTQPVQQPVLTTTAVTGIRQTSAQSGGSITSDGGAVITARGICWNTSPNPTTANSTTPGGTGIGNFPATLSSLAPNTTYYVRAYATNSAGTSYGAQVTVTTLALSIAGAGVTDVDGNNYPTVILADKEWMAQNLRTAKYRNGDIITNITDNNAWDNAGSGAWCHYNNTPGYDATYGKLYNRFAVVDARQLCPVGWHAPSLGEWTVLSEYLGGNNIAGGALKTAGTSDWASPNTNGSNISGFTALPGGQRSRCCGGFMSMGLYGYWYATDGDNNGPVSADGFRLFYNSARVQTNFGFNSRDGLSVRCIKD